MGNGKVLVVPPLSWAQIGAVAEQLLQRTFPKLLAVPGPVPVDRLFEGGLRSLGFDYGIEELPYGTEGRINPVEKVIVLSPETYEALLSGDPRARFTTAHEIGHALLHAKHLCECAFDSRKVLMLNRGEVKPFRNPERQADAFAGALLMPTRHVASMLQLGKGTREVMEKFAVSWSAAETRIAKLPLFQKK